jgi:hypothetical protein
MGGRICLMLALLTASGLGMGGCAPDPGETQINARVRSPDGKLEAIYADDLGGGAATGAIEEVFVVEPGASPSLGERVFSMECAHEIALAWSSPRTLTVSYATGADAKDGPGLRPSISSALSSAYWIADHPHGVQVRFVHALTEPPKGC